MFDSYSNLVIYLHIKTLKLDYKMGNASITQEDNIVGLSPQEVSVKMDAGLSPVAKQISFCTFPSLLFRLTCL